jgi:hypothetical protein
MVLPEIDVAIDPAIPNGTFQIQLLVPNHISVFVTGSYCTPLKSIGPALLDAKPLTDQRSVTFPLAGAWTSALASNVTVPTVSTQNVQTSLFPFNPATWLKMTFPALPVPSLKNDPSI